MRACVLATTGAIALGKPCAGAFIIDNVSFFDGLSHTLITWELDGQGGQVLLDEGFGLAMPDDEYTAQGIRFSEATAVLWANPSFDPINGAQVLGGSPHNFLLPSLFGDDIATEFVLEFLQPVRAVGFWMELGKSLPPPAFDAFDAVGNLLGSFAFTGDLVDGAFDDIINYGFIGIASETPIDRLVLIGGLGDGFFLDDLRFSSVPAPGGVVVMGVGALALLRRRRERA